ncbi:MAG: DMT family transporter, partial [Microgenomates group bacterium]
MNGVLALIISNIIWGGASPIFKFALQNIPPFTLAFIRFFFAGLIFLPLAIKNFQRISFRRWTEIFLVGFFGIFINITFFFLGLKKTESINVPIIASSGPVFLYIFSILFLKEKPRFKVFSGMLISFLGVLIIVLSPLFFDGKKILFGEVEGNFFILLATMGSVFQTLIGKDLLKKVNPYFVSAFSFLLSSFLFLFFLP